MLKPVVLLAAIGLAGIGLWKIAAVVLLPLFFLVFKIALVAGLILAAFWWFKRRGGKEDTPPATE